MAVADEILKVAELARLSLNEEERERFGPEFGKIVAYFSELQQLMLEGEMTLGYPCPRFEDVPVEYDIDIHRLSKNLKEGYFKIPPLLT
jgi:aspartyl/glutamyl-tRNA(Asn/Gln) amidotransferase C subunit